MPLFFWFDLFLEARTEILEKFLLVFWSKRWHQNDILKLTDLYLLLWHYILAFSETWTTFRPWEKLGLKIAFLQEFQSEFQLQKQLVLSNIFEFSRAFSCPVTCWLSALSWQSWNCRCELTAEQLLSNNKPPRNKTKKLNTCRKKCQIAPAKMDLSFTFLILLCTPAIFCAETCGKDAEGKWFKLLTKAKGR